MPSELLEKPGSTKPGKVAKEAVGRHGAGEGSRALRRLGGEKRISQTIGILGDRSWYVFADATVEELADDLTEHPSVLAVAVVEDDMTVHGVIARRDLMGALARPYGRDVLRRRPVREQAVDVRSFGYNQNIHTVSDALGDGLQCVDVSYYALVDDKKRFRGLFSSRQMLIYLSDMSRNDLEMARTLQKKLTGEVASIHEMKFDLVASSQTAKGVGGDYYSIDKYGDDKWLISVCDVSGKGMAASLITSVMWGMSSIFDFGKGLGVFVREVNRYLFRTFEAEKFVTGVFLDFDSASGKTLVCDMGHSYIYLFRKGKLSRIRTNADNLPIGIVPENEPVLNRMKLKPGDILFVPTDGLLEQENYAGELYAPERIQTVIGRNAGRQLDDIHAALIEDFNEFRGTRHLHDDVTYVLLKYFDEHDDGLAGG